MSQPEPPAGPPLDPLSESVRHLVGLADREAAVPDSSEQLTRRWHKLKRKLVVRARAGRSFPLAPALAVAVLAVLVGGAFAFVRGRMAKLSYDVDGGTVVSGGYVEAKSDDGPTIRFSDGTNIALASHTKVRLLSTDADGPKVALDDGEARVRVFHREGTRWLFDAGPFTIVVKGTSFVVHWSESDKWLRLHLKTGAVSVSGPLPSGELLVREGQELSVRLREGEIVLRDDETTRAPDWEHRLEVLRAQPEPSAGAPDVEPHREPSAIGRRRDEPSRGWAKMLATGKVAQILDEAQSLGDAATDDTSIGDLEALADAARYSAKYDLARRALASLRRRFPGGSRAARAAFLTGRLEEQALRSAKAVEWYDLYLREAPSGPYASDALGSKMGVLQRVYGNDKARPVAEDYLRRFPSGSYSAAAQALIARP
jgi:ferric-dicitrate binding protein FerR (iron transport regulator)